MRIVSRAALAAAALITIVPFAGVPRASAQQDSVSQQLDDIRNSIGLGKDRPPIDFTERAPLVVPPTYTLPPPVDSDPERLGVNDPDVAARRRALTDSRRPVPPTDPGAYATGRAARKYLVDPPSGLRDPAAVAADITHDSDGAPIGTGKARHTRSHHRKRAPAAAQ